MKINITAIAKIDQAKAKQLQLVLGGSSVDPFVGKNGICQFTTTNEYNPASIYDPNSVDPKGSLLIEIAQWYLRTHSAGYIIGMLCHEVGAHYMATAALTKNAYTQGPTSSSAKIHSEQHITKQKMKIKDAATGWWYAPAKVTQADHVFASCSGFARYKFYRDLMIEFAEVIAFNRRSNSSSFAANDLPDLLDCWLMDIASILATSDARAWGAILPYANYLTTAYNAHLTKLKSDRTTLTLDSDVQNAIQGLSQKWTYQVVGAYGGMIPKLFK
ncbi:hypothetical protein ACNOYE_02215 [Nannocystaceae bacterium ST9]